MKLLHCHVENFGKLSDYSYVFRDGLNSIHMENGTGKSTFAAFIRVMFFGFQGESKRGEFENERRFFAPWQKGTYGGQITFSIGDRSYILTRVFGKTAKDDEFRLQDAQTKLDSQDYSVNIGEEILEIDAASFLRTVYVGQADCAACAATDSISAKLGNLAENTDDINNYEAVNKRMTDMFNSLSPKRSTGKIAKLKKEIAQLTEEVRAKDALEEAMQQLGEKRESSKQKKDALLKEQADLQRRLEKASRQEELRTKKAQYEQLVQDCADKQQEFEAVQAYFPGELPEKQDIIDMQKIVQRLSELEKKENSQTLSASELEKLSGYEEKFSQGVPGADEIAEKQEQWSMRQQIKALLSIKRGNVQTEEAREDERKLAQKRRNIQCSVVLILIGLVLVWIGVFAPVKAVIRIAVFACLFVAFVLGIRMLIKKEAMQDNAELLRMRRECEEDITKINEIDGEIRSFLARYRIDYDENTVGRELQLVKDAAWEYGNLSAKKGDLLTPEEISEQQSKTEELHTFIQPYVKEAAQPTTWIAYMGLLKDLEQHLTTYEKIKTEYETCKTKKQAWENMQETDVKETDLQEMEQPDVYKDKLASVREQYENEMHALSEYTRQLDEKTEEFALLEEKEEKLQILHEEVRCFTKKCDIIEKTQTFLAKAKESFTGRYTKPLLSGFEKYYRLIADEVAEEYELDAKLNMERKEQGIYRDMRHLSNGYQDLIGLCMRMAMVDAMYQQEKPFIVLDDPFVNLDESKLQGAKVFLEKLSETYQVIYFTCHESRV